MNLVEFKRQVLVLLVCCVTVCAAGTPASLHDHGLSAAGAAASSSRTTATNEQSFLGKMKQWVLGAATHATGQQFPFDLEYEEEPLPIDLAQYEDEAVLRFNWTTSRQQQQFLHAAETLVLDVWSLKDDSGDVRINKRRVRDFLRLLPRGMRLESRRSVYIEDLQQAVSQSVPVTARGGFFEEFRDLQEIDQWVAKRLATADQKSIGKSSAGRDLNSITIGTGPKKLLVASGMSAREWIGVSSSLYALEQLLNDEEVLSKATVTFLPVANPDGYIYTWTQDRLWRKNRQPTGVSMCSGFDLSQSLNWTAELSTSPVVTACSESFAGKEPFQAVEAKHISNLLKRHDAFIDFASYTQQLVGKSVPEALANKIWRATGHDYHVVQDAEFYPQVSQALQVRLPDLDGTGVLMNKKHIEAMGQEVLKILKVVVDEI